jgi:hypothetical protein
MDNNNSSILKDSADQLDKLGKTRSTTTLYICCIIGLVLIIWAFSFLFIPTLPYTIATIDRIEYCKPIGYGSSRSISCQYLISYQINNLKYANKTLNTDTPRGNVGDTIEIEYDPKNPDIIYEKKNNLSLSFILLLIAAILIGFSYNNYVQTHNSKIYSVAQGAATVTETIFGPRYMGPGYMGPGYMGPGYMGYRNNIYIGV